LWHSTSTFFPIYFYFIKEIKSKTWFIKDIFISKKGIRRYENSCQYIFFRLGRGYILPFDKWRANENVNKGRRRRKKRKFYFAANQYQTKKNWKFLFFSALTLLFFIFGTHQEFIYFYWKIQSGENGENKIKKIFLSFFLSIFCYLIAKVWINGDFIFRADEMHEWMDCTVIYFNMF